MRFLREQNFLNAPQEYERIFEERKDRPQIIDISRWKELFKYYKGGTLLDIGCLDSLIPYWAKQKYPKDEIWGLDQAKKVVEEMSKTFPEINYTHGDVYQTLFPDNYFDYVVAGELIEHLERPKDFIKEVFRILKPGGKLALSTPKEETEAGEVDQYRHLWSFSASDIRDLCRFYMKGAKIYELPSWIKRRIKYYHPYLIALITKKKETYRGKS